MRSDTCLLRVAGALVLASLASPAAFPGQDLARWVDPFIGTGGHGHTFPGPTLPFGMVQLGPDTRLTGWDGCSGYHDDDRRVFGFSHTHLSGTGISDYGDVLVLPAAGPIRLESGYGQPADRGYGSRFRKDREHAAPGDYRVHLEDYGIDVELTTTLRTGWHRYTFPLDSPGHVLFDLTHRDTVLESRIRIVDERTIEGMRRSSAWARDQVIYFVARLSEPVDAQIAIDRELRPDLHEAEGTDLRAVLQRRPDAGSELLIKVGISAVDLEGARQNLAAEAPGWDFDAVRAAARRQWNEELGAIEIEGGTDEQRTIFYTALYHALLQPNLFQDVDGRYRGHDRAIHRAEDYTRYTVFSLWDTFRATHPLYHLIQRRRSVDFLRTFLAQYRESGRLPVWELAGEETDTMIGYHSVAVIADAWAKGIRDFDAPLALEAMKAAAEADRFGLDDYRRLGFVAADREAESVSKTLEYAYDDWCIAQVADDLGATEDRDRYLARSQAWRHLLAPDGSMRPRSEGRWIEPFDPTEVTFHFTEANAWQYSFFVPHDIAGWMEILGGSSVLERRLDELFTTEGFTGRDQADITGTIGQYAHGNEPSHHMAYLYAFAGVPAKTQSMVHRLMETMYSDRPDGLAGNEDCGQMSSWFLFSALGFYPVTPGSPEYVLGSPLFDRATIHLENGRQLVVEARRTNPGDAYVQSARWNGVEHRRAVLDHTAILEGGILELELGPSPSTWGTATGDRPRTAVPGHRVIAAPVAAGPTVATEPVSLSLVPVGPTDAIHYSLGEEVPDHRSPTYREPLRIDPPERVTFRARRGDDWSPAVAASIRRLEPGKRIHLVSPTHRQYGGGSDQALIDGLLGDLDFRLGRWQGFYGIELDVRLDLGSPRPLERLTIGFLHDQNSWIFLPWKVHFELSDDGADWRPAGSATTDFDPHHQDPARVEFALDLDSDTEARWIRITTSSRQFCPDWHKGAGNRSFLFADELTVDER